MKKKWMAVALSVAANASAVETVIDELQITADTNITVAAGDALRLEYVWATAPYTVTKSGAGKLTLAVIGIG